MEIELQESLDQLRAEIKDLEGEDTESKARIQKLIGQLEKQIEEDDDILEEISEHVTDSISHFGTSHPRLTVIMNDIMTLLGNIGI